MKKNKKRTKMRAWQRVVLIIALVLLTAGVGFLVFPAVSNSIGQMRADAMIEQYDAALGTVIDPASPDSAPEQVTERLTAQTFEEARQKSEVDSEGYVIDKNGSRLYDIPVIFRSDLDRLRKDSIAYNESIINHQGTPDTLRFDRAVFDLGSYGLSNVYAYLKADTIGLHLPIYLGASDWAMSCGGAHLYGTSLPLNQNNTNVAIAGHTGYIGRIFFDNIRNLSIGDTVKITNYWETVSYKVIETKTVAPDDANDLLIQPGKRLLTLITCTHYSDGSYARYLVLCEAV